MYKRHLVGLLSNHLATNMVRISRSTATVCDRHFVLADHLGRIFNHSLHYNVRLPNQFGVDSHQWHQQHFFRLCEACAISQQRVFATKHYVYLRQSNMLAGIPEKLAAKWKNCP